MTSAAARSGTRETAIRRESRAQASGRGRRRRVKTAISLPQEKGLPRVMHRNCRDVCCCLSLGSGNRKFWKPAKSIIAVGTFPRADFDRVQPTGVLRAPCSVPHAPDEGGGTCVPVLHEAETRQKRAAPIRCSEAFSVGSPRRHLSSVHTECHLRSGRTRTRWAWAPCRKRRGPAGTG